MIRGQKVMLDSDLANLYGVETKTLNRQVRINESRFPEYFMFKLSPDEYESLKCQIGTSKTGRGEKQKQPLVFRENGVAMLSGILRSERAVAVNIAIMRTFTNSVFFQMFEKDLTHEMSSLKESVTNVFKVVFERLDHLDKQLPTHLKDREKIGLKKSKK